MSASFPELVGIRWAYELRIYREIHREQLSIEHSMRDLDSAVGRLDNILMSLYFIIVILIFAVALVSVALVAHS